MAEGGAQLLRIGISLFIALVMAFLTLGAIQGGSAEVRSRGITAGDIKAMKSVIDAYADKNGDLPTSVTDLIAAGQISEPLTDYWGDPLIYSTDGRTYDIVSLGRDGKPGGVGLDCDVSLSNPSPAGSGPPLTAGKLVWAAVSAVMGFYLGMVLFRNIELTPKWIPGTILRLIAVFVPAFFVAGTIAALLTPTGH